MNAHRLRPAAVTLAAVALAAVLTGCQGKDSAAGADGGPSTAATAGSAATGKTGTGKTGGGKTGSGKGGPSEGAGKGKSGATAGSGGGAAATPAAKVTGGAKSKAPAAGCATTAPDPDHVDPDEFALYRVEELDGSTGKVNLVIQHGAWGCPGGDGEGAPFVVTGEDSRWALDQAAYVTATNPVTDSSENQRIGVNELIDWVKAHPDSGLVFKYETGADGSIDRLEQVYAP
ncbi:hypothetical protein GCM10010503_31850 [Streptomyces lucensis JCM 4490]|uniref:Lipoprotein n=1 Tax=Streptomyces lucensis JCM 4490 TaxID=1306176 RepID=A0A918MSD5_9ACTN|nr:hypothetical protein [Streptomyces lucensis]GGW52438.1 hypothetical protein GCM10010503_31850 [Streptomyces lucensis JCM 4490]